MSALLLSVLAVSCFFTPNVSSLKCAVGLVDVNHGYLTAAVTINCTQDNPQCMEYQIENDSGQYRIFFCISYEVAANSYYGIDGGLCERLDDFQPDPCLFYCSDLDNCNSLFAEVGTYNSSSQTTAGTRKCYSGVVASGSPYLAGGIEMCDGPCVTYETHSNIQNRTQIYGCVPWDVSSPLIGTSNNSCVSRGDMKACFCVDDLCNVPPQPYPTLPTNLTCYVGFGYNGNNFSGSIQQCQSDEVCTAYTLGVAATFYQCVKMEACYAYHQGGIETPCGLALDGWDCCCATNLCNYSPSLMAPNGVFPTENPITNNNNLQCLEGFQYTGERVQPFVGETRPCSGACSYTSYYPYWHMWRCLDVDVCTSLGVPMGTCQEDIYGITIFCCFANETSTPVPLTTLLPSTTPSTGECPAGWIASKTVSNKCYHFGVLTPDAWGVALTKCLSLNVRSSLVAIRNGFENSEFVQIDPNIGYNWLGLYWTNGASGAWSWVDGQAVNYTNWAPGEPSTNEGCAKIDTKGLWHAVDCYDDSNVVCELYL